MTENKLYLAVWNLGGEKAVSISLAGLSPKSLKVAYPLSNKLDARLTGNTLEIDFTENYQARMLEIEL
jgi:hypothetical protein